MVKRRVQESASCQCWGHGDAWVLRQKEKQSLSGDVPTSLLMRQNSKLCELQEELARGTRNDFRSPFALKVISEFIHTILFFCHWRQKNLSQVPHLVRGRQRMSLCPRSCFLTQFPLVGTKEVPSSVTGGIM